MEYDVIGAPGWGAAAGGGLRWPEPRRDGEDDGSRRASDDPNRHLLAAPTALAAAEFGPGALAAAPAPAPSAPIAAPDAGGGSASGFGAFDGPGLAPQGGYAGAPSASATGGSAPAEPAPIDGGQAPAFQPQADPSATADLGGDPLLAAFGGDGFGAPPSAGAGVGLSPFIDMFPQPDGSGGAFGVDYGDILALIADGAIDVDVVNNVTLIQNTIFDIDLAEGASLEIADGFEAAPDQIVEIGGFGFGPNETPDDAAAFA